MANEGSERKGDAELLTVAEAAEFIGISTQAIYAAIHRGALPTVTAPMPVRAVRREDAEAYRKAAQAHRKAQALRKSLRASAA